MKTNENQRFSAVFVILFGFAQYFQCFQTNKPMKTNPYATSPSPSPGGGEGEGHRGWFSLVYWFIGLKTLKTLSNTTENDKNQ